MITVGWEVVRGLTMDGTRCGDCVMLVAEDVLDVRGSTRLLKGELSVRIIHRSKGKLTLFDCHTSCPWQN